MALPDISFANNLGTIAFRRATITISTDWQWDGRNPYRKRSISVNAMVSRDAGERLDGVSTNPSSSQPYGGLGTLTLPWTLLQNIRLDRLEIQSNAFLTLFPVQATFSDFLPSNNLYTMTFFGIELHAPKLSLPSPVRSTVDQYHQVPLLPKGTVDHWNPWYGPVRYRAGFGAMDIALAGTTFLLDGQTPTDLVQTLQQRVGVGSVGGDLPQGYPATFAMGDAIPELRRSLQLTNVFVNRASFDWNVERRSVSVRIGMTAQPQSWAEV